jgi:hypothetical protein
VSLSKLVQFINALGPKAAPPRNMFSALGTRYLGVTVANGHSCPMNVYTDANADRRLPADVARGWA